MSNPQYIQSPLLMSVSGNGCRQDEDLLLDEHGFVNWEHAFKAQPDHVRWIIEPLIEAGRLHSLFGPAQAGKSLVSMELACRVIDAGKTVLYVDNENGLEEWVSRLTSFGRTPEDLDRLYCLPYASMPTLDTAAGGAELLSKAVLVAADVVWIDTTSRFIDGKENDSDTFLKVYRHSLLKLKKHGIAVVRLDHTGKDEERGQRGSSAKDQDLDYIWRITSDGKGTRTVTCEKSRSARPLKMGDKLTLRAHEISPDNPVFYHEWDYRTAMAPEPEKVSAAKILEEAGIPAEWGRKRVRSVTDTLGIKMMNSTIDAAQQYRRGVRESSGHPADRTDTG